MAIDIDRDAVNQARSNANVSPWAERITTLCADVQSFHTDALFDHIVSNPPYFIDALSSPDAARTVARHTASLSFCELINAACRLLRRGLGADAGVALLSVLSCVCRFRFPRTQFEGDDVVADCVDVLELSGNEGYRRRRGFGSFG